MESIPDLEIGLYRYDDEYLLVNLRLEIPGEDHIIRPQHSRPVRFDLDRLRPLALEPERYGETLWSMLFADANLQTLYNQALVVARQRSEPGAIPAVRVRLFISPEVSQEVLLLRWECLRDPASGIYLAMGEGTVFSRYFLTADWRPLRPRPDELQDLRAVVAIANPRGLTDWSPGGRSLATVQVQEELTRARLALEGMEVVELAGLPTPGAASTQHATLDGITTCLRDGCDILYLVCHGSLMEGRPWLWLENEAGQVDRVSGTELVNRIKELQWAPRLVVLASCQSAGTGAEIRSGDQGAMAALGPRLVEAGVPAVLAMQGDVTMATAGAFLTKFFAELSRDGAIDRAAAVARGAVRNQADWWVPVLFMRLKTGMLWSRAGLRSDTIDWVTLVRRVGNGNCTPILGSGILEPLLGTTRAIARRWAELYHFPLAPQGRDDLPQVAQYLEVAMDRQFPREELALHLVQMLRRKLPEATPPIDADNLDTAIVRAGQALQERDPQEPHRLLASLPFPVYITTNGDSLLFNSLKNTRSKSGQLKQPTVGVFNSAEFSSSPSAVEPSEAAPLVYHLFGHLGDPGTLVLTEDDYFDFLIDVTGRRREIPPVVRRRLTKATLLLIGFRLDEWDFRVLARAINAMEGSSLLRNYSHVAVQIDPESGRFLDPDSAVHFLQKHTCFAGRQVSIAWGKVEVFLAELARRVEAAQPPASLVGGAS